MYTQEKEKGEFTYNDKRSPNKLHQKRRNSASDGWFRRVQGKPRMRNRSQGVVEGTKIRVPDELPVVSLRPWTNTTLCLEFDGCSIYSINKLVPDLIHQLDPCGKGFYSYTMWGTAQYGNKWTNISGTDCESKVIKIQIPNIVSRIRNIKVWSVNKTPFQLKIHRIKTDPDDDDEIVFEEEAPNAKGDKFALGYTMPLICRKTPLYAKSTTREPQPLFEIYGDKISHYSVQINLEWKICNSAMNSDSESDQEKRRLSDYSVSDEEDPSTCSIYSDPAVISAKSSTDSIPGIPNTEEISDSTEDITKRLEASLSLTASKLGIEFILNKKDNAEKEEKVARHELNIEEPVKVAPGTYQSRLTPLPSIVPSTHVVEKTFDILPINPSRGKRKYTGTTKKGETNRSNVSGNPDPYFKITTYSGATSFHYPKFDQ